MNPLPSVDTMYTMIICEEKHVVITRNQDGLSKAIAFAARVPDKSGFVGNVCHKTCHFSLDCFQVIGFTK